MPDIPPFDTGLFLKMQPRKLLEPENISIFIRRFRMWACHHRCDHTLDFFSVVVITEEITHSFQDVTLGRQLVAQWFAVWEVPNKAVEKDYVILRISMKISSLSEAWRALVIMGDT